MPSIPSVGKISIGIGEKIFNPWDNSGLFKALAINSEKRYKNEENTAPKKNINLEIFLTISRPSSRLYLGRK
ncbi:hypothetical protein DESUT3_37620 [Desulfuromonas versatilis]|uniref:Uncharacterized protein n=1 Tax=Desulfuromonas versatilis TaxID=2802975 RepID=A0ABM8I197_9BACT|nr:hypothetical protein DESUT3_37620 [Desulfuromonas versatilis]